MKLSTGVLCAIFQLVPIDNITRLIAIAVTRIKLSNPCPVLAWGLRESNRGKCDTLLETLKRRLSVPQSVCPCGVCPSIFFRCIFRILGRLLCILCVA